MHYGEFIYDTFKISRDSKNQTGVIFEINNLAVCCLLSKSTKITLKKGIILAKYVVSLVLILALKLRQKENAFQRSFPAAIQIVTFAEKLRM